MRTPCPGLDVRPTAPPDTAGSTASSEATATIAATRMGSARSVAANGRTDRPVPAAIAVTTPPLRWSEAWIRRASATLRRLARPMGETLRDRAWARRAALFGTPSVGFGNTVSWHEDRPVAASRDAAPILGGCWRRSRPPRDLSGICYRIDRTPEGTLPEVQARWQPASVAGTATGTVRRAASG